MKKRLNRKKFHFSLLPKTSGWGTKCFERKKSILNTFNFIVIDFARKAKIDQICRQAQYTCAMTFL